MLQKSPSEAKLSGRGKKNRSTWRRRGGGAAGVSWCLAPRRLVAPRPFHGEMEERAHREACVGCAFHNRHIPSSFLLTCRCLLPSAPLPVSTCSYSPLAPPSGSAPTLPEGLKQPAPAPPVQLTSVVPLRLPGHWLAAGIVSHARAPVPSALPGPPSPEAPGSRAKPKAASVFYPPNMECVRFPSVPLVPGLPTPLQPVRLGLSLRESLTLKHKHTLAKVLVPPSLAL